MQNFDLRKAVQQYVSRAIDSSVNYTGKEYDLNRHNWTQITTDRIIAAVMNCLPEPVDVRSKYEMGDQRGIFVNIGSDESPEHNEQQIDYLAQYQADQGWNNYYGELTDYLKALYTLPSDVVQSDYERDGFHRTSESDGPNDKEPSKIR